MKLDADKLRGEAEELAARMKSPLWSRDDGQADEHWTASLRNDAPAGAPSASRAPSDESPPQPPPVSRAAFPDAATTSTLEILPRLDALDHAVGKLTAAMSRRPVGGDGFPSWLEGAAGNPHAYDAPHAGRTGVCVRILPTTYAQLQQIQRRMGLRTIAAAWEFLLRLGLAAAERLPSP